MWDLIEIVPDHCLSFTVQFNILSNSISVLGLSGQREWDNKKSVCTGTPFTVGKIAASSEF